MRVLIVENSTIIAMHLATLVTDLGHEVCARAASASDAIAQAAALKPHVAIMDLRLAKAAVAWMLLARFTSAMPCAASL